MSYKVAPLTVNPKQKSSFMSKAFVSQPSAEEELLVGRLFVLMEIDQSRTDDFALADFIVKEIYRHYYENEQFFLRDKIANLKIDYIFEAALTKLNRGIAEFLEAQKISFRPGGLTIVIGVLHKNRLLFSETGSSKAFLLYQPKVKTGQVLGDFNLMDISEKTDDPTQEISNNNKLFANVINGAIPAGGYFLFANEAVLEYLSKKQLTDIITTLPPTSAVEQMKNLLEQTNAFVPFFALIVKNTVGEEKVTDFANVISPLPVSTGTMGGGRTSVDQFNTTQERTEELLSTSGVLTVKKWLAKLQPASSTLKSYAQDTARTINLSAGKLKAHHSTLAIGKKVVDFFRIIISLVLDSGKTIFRLVTDQSARQGFVETSKNSFKKLLLGSRNIVERLRHLNPKQKVILSIIAACLLLFVGNLTYSAITSKQKAEAARVAQAQSDFEQKEHQLEASLLYNNIDGAKQILLEMNGIIESLPSKTEKDKSAITALTDRYHSRSDRIFAVTRITTPTVFVELPSDGNDLTLTETDLFASNGASKTIYQISNDKKITSVSSEEFSGKTITTLTDDPDTYFWDEDNLFTFVPLDKTIKKMSIENKPGTLSSVAIYNTRLYAASTTDKTIFRFNQDKRSFSFSSRQEWLKEKLSSENVSSVSVNGKIFTINDQQVHRYTTGNDDLITLDPTTPTLESPTKIAISQDQKLLYILEPKHNRVLVYTVDGVYKAQYTSDSFNNLKGLAVTEDNKKLYILNDKTIYEVAIDL
jgi:hypothetical protein